MSRIGKTPIILNPNISIQIKENNIKIEGPKGKLEHFIPQGIEIEMDINTIYIKTNNNSKRTKELHGLSRTIINNMVTGVSIGFSKVLEIRGVGYRAQLDNKNNLILNVGYSHPVHITTPKNIKIEVKNNNQIIVSGINKMVVGQIASQIRAVRPPEPYKGKGIRYQNEIIKTKVGKAGK